MNAADLLSSILRLIDEKLLQAILGSLFGTFAGAVIARRSQTRKDVLAELGAAGAARQLTVATINTLIMLKSQHLMALVKEYEAEQERLDGFLLRPDKDASTFALRLDLKNLPALPVPITHVTSIIFDKVPLRGRGLAATVEFSAAVQHLNDAIVGHRKLVEEFRIQLPSWTREQAAFMYLGRTNGAGVSDMRFHDTIDVIISKANDGLYFGKLLAEALASHELRLYRSNRWKRFYGLKRLRPVPNDWSRIGAGILPDEADYAGWVQNFIRIPTLRQRIVACARTNWQRFTSHKPA